MGIVGFDYGSIDMQMYVEFEGMRSEKHIILGMKSAIDFYRFQEIFNLRQEHLPQQLFSRVQIQLHI